MYEIDDVAGKDNPTVAPESDEKLQIDLDLATPNDRGKQMHAIPRCGSLEGLTELSSSLQGIELATLVPFDTILVRTVNSDYRMFMLDPETGRALLEGGKITEPVEATVLGSSFGGAVLRTRWIGVGLRIEAWADEKYIRTSPVQSLCVEHETSAQLTSHMYL
jgi:hypothetical protein